jgi:hypothetical protein
VLKVGVLAMLPTASSADVHEADVRVGLSQERGSHQ